MATEPDHLNYELAILADLHLGSDPLLASLSAAMFIEDAAGIVLSDEEIEAGLLDPVVMDRLRRSRGQGA